MSRRAVGWAVVVAMRLLVCGDALALDPGRFPSQYVNRAWGIDQGLPQTSVHAIAQTSDGFLWIGTTNGLARFDGVKFTVFDAETLPLLGDAQIQALTVARGGALWIGTPSGAFVFEQGRFRKLSLGGLADHSVTAIVEDDKGTMWIGTSGEIARFDGRRFVRVEAKLSGDYIAALQVVGDGIWVATWGGLDHIRGGAVEHFLQDHEVNAISRDLNGNLLVGTDRGLFTYDGRQMSPADGETDEVLAIVADRDRNLWIGTRHGLKRWRDGHSEFVHASGRSDDFVATIFEDRDGSLWVGMHIGGLHQLSDGSIVTHRVDDGLGSNSVWSVAMGPDGAVWAGSEGGLDRFDGRRWEHVALPQSKSGVIAVLPESSGTWIAAYGAGLLHLADRRVAAWNGSRYVFALFRDRAGVLWVGATNGLWKLERETWTKYTMADGLPYDDVRFLIQDRSGHLWVATTGGVCVRDGERFSTRVGRTQLPQGTTWGLFEDSAGDLWFTGHSGLYRLRGEHLFAFTPQHGLIAGDIGQILESPRDVMWLSTMRGIARIDRRQLDAVARGDARRFEATLIGVSEGFPRNGECTFGGAPAASVARDGRIWFPTTEGIAAVDPGVRRSAAATPVLEEIIVDGVHHSTAAPLRLGPETNRIEFHYTSATFIDPGRTRFRYRLEGFDGDWVDVASRRVAYYTRLPAGPYRFHLQAAGADGRWIEAAAANPIELRPRFHRTVWFRLLCVAALLVMTWFLHAYRIRVVEMRHTAVVQERARIARELHDTVAQDLAGLTLQLEAALQLLPDATRVRGQLEKAKKTAAQGLGEARRALFRLRSHDVEDADLSAALKRRAAEMTAGSHVRAEVTITGATKSIGADTAAELLRIAQEAIANALRHAAATRIEIVLEVSPRRVLLRVSDNGHGSGPFQLDDLNAMRFGLIGMRERAERIGGRLTTKSDPQHGTEIAVEIPA